MRKLLVPGAALMLLAGCAGNPLAGRRADYYVPNYVAPAWAPPSFDDAPVYVDPPRYVPRSAPRAVERVRAYRDPDPVAFAAPEADAPDDGSCHGWWRMCGVLPGWRYED